MSLNQKYKPSHIEKLYKEQAEKYTNFAENSFSWIYLERPLMDKVMSIMTVKNPQVLDAGCGMGRTLKYLLDKKIPKSNILGVDISDDMLKVARKNVPNVKMIKSDLTNLKINQKFDLIVCTHVLHYLDEIDFRKVLKVFYRLLKKNGILFFVITHPIRSAKQNLADYFKRDWILDRTPWGTESPLFLRPIADIVNETIESGFILHSVEEPSVPMSAKKKDLNSFQKYSSCPSRIGIIAKK